MKRNLYIYMTSYKNANRIERCIHSLYPLNPTGIYVTDNCSPDGTFEILKKYKNIVATQVKSRRGEGRNIALNGILDVAKPDDLILQVDPDVIYKKAYIDFVKKKMKTIKDNEIYADMGSLSTAKTNKDLPWMPLNASEDAERFANAITKGIKVYKLDISDENEWDKYWDGEKVGKLNMKADREARYESNNLGKYIRFFRHLMDDERGLAIKSFSGFYSMASVKSTVTYVAFLLAYGAAKAKGIYVHDRYLNNGELIKKRSIYVKG